MAYKEIELEKPIDIFVLDSAGNIRFEEGRPKLLTTIKSVCVREGLTTKAYSKMPKAIVQMIGENQKNLKNKDPENKEISDVAISEDFDISSFGEDLPPFIEAIIMAPGNQGRQISEGMGIEDVGNILSGVLDLKEGQETQKSPPG